MKNIKSILSIAVFVLLLFLPNCIFPAVAGYIDTENHEKRTYAEFPGFSRGHAEEFFKGLETYYTDRVPFKNQFKKLHSQIEAYFAGSESPYAFYNNTPEVTRGRDGWLFYTGRNKDDFATEDYVGTDLYTDEELQEIARRYQLVRDACALQGTEVVFFFAPGKEQIYDCYMPKNFPAHAPLCRVSQLTQYLRENTDMHVVYPYERLRELRDRYQLYYRYDTHWNGLGAFVGLQAIIQELTGKCLSLEEIGYHSEPTPDMFDLALLLGIEDSCRDDLDYRITEYPTDIRLEKMKKDKALDCYRRKSNAADQRRVLVLHDSFGQLWYNQMNFEFSDVTFTMDSVTGRDLLEKEKPDLLIIEIAGRYAVMQETWAPILIDQELPAITVSEVDPPVD